MDTREANYRLSSAGGDRGFMEAYNNTTATSVSPLRQRDTSGFSASSYEHHPGHFHDSTSLLCSRRSPFIKECYEDQFPFELARDVHYNPWSPNSTSAPAWCPSEPSPSPLLNSEYSGAPAFLMGYGADNISSEYEAQLPWPDSEHFPLRADVANFEDDVDPFGITYYTPRGIDGAPDSICDPSMTLHPLAVGRAASTRSTQQSVSEASPGGVTFRALSRLDVAGRTAPVMMSMREAEEQTRNSVILKSLDQSLNPPSPLSVISPPTSLSSSARKRNISMAGLERSPVTPKKRVIKPQLTAKVDNSEDFEIQKDSESAPTGIYKAYFQTVGMARKKLQRLLELYRKPKESCSFPSTDDTFPTSDDDKMVYIKSLFDAINDWSHFREWPQALKTEERNRIMDDMRRRQAGSDDAGTEISLDDMRPSQEELQSLLPPLQDQQKKILGRLLSDQTIEWLCWELIVSNLELARRHTCERATEGTENG